MNKIFFVFALIFITTSVLLSQENPVVVSENDLENTSIIENVEETAGNDIDNSSEKLDIKESIISLLRNTAFGGFFPKSEEDIAEEKIKEERSIREKYEIKLHDIQIKKVPLWQNLIMICVGLVLVYLAIAKGFEPLLLIPIGMGGILANIPVANIAAIPVVQVINNIPVTLSAGGFLGQVYTFGIEAGLFPLFIFMGVGAMTDFGPLIANPKTALLGAAAQIGIFGTLLGAMLLSAYVPVITFTQASSGASVRH